MASNWAIVIGINQYRFLQPLKYAKRDAEAMSEFLRQEAGFDRIFLFTDDSPPIGDKTTEPFRNNLLRVLRQIFTQPFMKDGDNFWFFFSGHGIRHNEQDYLMPVDGDPEDVENTGIPTQLISNYLRSCGADNVVMILDACRSGGKKSGEGIGKQTEEEARQTGVISIFSCSPDQYSYELESIGQGAFTYTLIEGLGIRGRCATVERLNQYLQSQVPQLVQQLGRVRQIPYTIAEPIERSHLILMPQHATLADISTLKNDAYNAQVDENWDVAERLWTRVLTAALGQDTDAIRALQRIAIKRNPGTIFPQTEQELQQSASNRSAIRVSSSPIPLVSQASSLHQLNRQQFLRWGIPATIGVVGVAIASQSLKGHSSIDYSRLENFLKTRNWRSADQETLAVMLKVANRVNEGRLNSNDIERFPCESLRVIDQLWQKHSGNLFCFSVQRHIYKSLCDGITDGKYYETALNCFGDRVGWRINEEWLNSPNYSAFSQGHLPFFAGWGTSWKYGSGEDDHPWEVLFLRVERCI